MNTQELDPKTKSVLEDMQTVLGLPTPAPLLARLTQHPWFLQLAWRNLKPNVGIAYFQRMAADVAGHALDHVKRSGSAEGTASGLNEAVEKLLNTESKLLLVAGALRAGAQGQLPKMMVLRTDDTRPAPAKQNDSVPSVSVDSATADRLRAALNETCRWPEAMEFQELMAWPDQLAQVWTSASRLLGDANRHQHETDLRQRAMLVAEALPFRMEISATACRQAGIGEQEIDATRRIMEDEWGEIPRRLLCAASMAATLGVKRAAHLPIEPASPVAVETASP